jgi:hypothetical protein
MFPLLLCRFILLLAFIVFYTKTEANVVNKISLHHTSLTNSQKTSSDLEDTKKLLYVQALVDARLVFQDVELDSLRQWPALANSYNVSLSDVLETW